MYATLGGSESALGHARRCLELTETGGDGFADWDLPSARQALAHAHIAAGEMEEARRWAGLAREALAGVEDPEDRGLMESQIVEVGL